jgi:hypothetical protein
VKPRDKRVRSKRPPAVTVIAIAIVVLFAVRAYQSVVPVLEQGIFRQGITSPLLEGWHLTALGSLLLVSLAYLLLSLAGIVVLGGFLSLRRWSWIFLMAWTGASLVVSLLDYLYRDPNYLVMASNVIIAFALNLRSVRRIFGVYAGEGGDA